MFFSTDKLNTSLNISQSVSPTHILKKPYSLTKKFCPRDKVEPKPEDIVTITIEGRKEKVLFLMYGVEIKLQFFDFVEVRK